MEVPPSDWVFPSFHVEMISSPMPQVRRLSEHQRSSRTRSPDVNNSAEVGKVSPSVSDGGGTDGDDRGGAGRGEVRGVTPVVPGGSNGGHTRGDEVSGSIVDGSRECTAQAHRSNGRAATAFSGAGDPIHPGNAAGNVSIDPNPALARRRGTHTSAQVPDL